MLKVINQEGDRDVRTLPVKSRGLEKIQRTHQKRLSQDLQGRASGRRTTGPGRRGEKIRVFNGILRRFWRMDKRNKIGDSRFSAGRETGRPRQGVGIKKKIWSHCEQHNYYKEEHICG